MRRNFNRRSEKTKTVFDQVSKLDYRKSEIANMLLKKTILDGVGPYAALAAKLMCHHIKNNMGTGWWGDEPSLGEILETQETYLSIAREKNH